MTVSISNIRFNIEREIGETLDDETFLIWCNNAQTDFSLMLNVPDSATIVLNAVDLKYPEPADMKAIRRMYLQSDIDNGRNIEFTWGYYRYNGFINFYTPYYQADTLNIEYFRHMKYFTSKDDTIDIEDRFITVYTYYCKAMFYAERKTVQGSSIRDFRLASMAAQNIMNMYTMVKRQVIAYYSLANESYAVKERW